MNKIENKLLAKIFEKIGKIAGKTECLPEIKRKVDIVEEKVVALEVGFNNHLKSHEKASKFKRWLVGVVIMAIIAVTTLAGLYIKIKYGA